MNMNQWIKNITESKEKGAMPILSFPCVSLMNVTVRELLESEELIAKGMKCVADKTPSLASVSMMDLSAEAEAFGSKVNFYENDVPTVVGSIVSSVEDAEALTVPKPGEKRTGRYLEAVRKAKEMITDRPVFSGVIGPFSLAGRLMGVSEAMMNCLIEPDMVKVTLEKATEFIISYILAYKAVGADGVILAEPLSGMLSPALSDEFSDGYVKEIISRVQDDEFAVIYHNCGDNVEAMLESLVNTGAAAYHFGNSSSMQSIMKKIPENVIAMGNIDPAGLFLNGTPEEMEAEVTKLMTELSGYKNFIISSGCDIPPMSKWENINAFYEAVKSQR